MFENLTLHPHFSGCLIYWYGSISCCSCMFVSNLFICLFVKKFNVFFAGPLVTTHTHEDHGSRFGKIPFTTKIAITIWTLFYRQIFCGRGINTEDIWLPGEFIACQLWRVAYRANYPWLTGGWMCDKLAEDVTPSPPIIYGIWRLNDVLLFLGAINHPISNCASGSAVCN